MAQQWRDTPNKLDNGNDAIVQVINNFLKLAKYERFKEKKDEGIVKKAATTLESILKGNA